MKTIDHSGFAVSEVSQTIEDLSRKLGETLNNLKSRIREPASPAHVEPGFRERHLLDKNLGPAIRRTWW